MILDNFDLLCDRFPEVSGHAYLVYVQRRRKDGNLDLEAMSELFFGIHGFVLVDYFLVKDGADLMARKEEITQACEMNNARAYLCPHAKNLAHIGIRAKEIYEEGQREGDEEKMRYAHFIACLQEKDVAQMRLLIDVDDEWGYDPQEISLYLYRKTQEEPIYVPTINGCHLICKPIPKGQIRGKYHKLAIIPYGPTVLYYANDSQTNI